MVQAQEVADRLRAAWPALAGDGGVQIVGLSTRGDRILDRPLAALGGKGLFTEEIEAALHTGDIDIAVHSLKDVPTVLPGGLELGAVLPREHVGDVLLGADGRGLDALPAGARVGTSGLRRQAQVLAYRPDLQVIPFRGNVQTRLRKLAEGEAEATIFAAAGLNRLGRAIAPDTLIPRAVMVPAVAQGAIGLEVRTGDTRTAALVAPLHCAQSATQVTAERAFLRALDGSCRTPIAANAILAGDAIQLEGFASRADGTGAMRLIHTGPADDPVVIGKTLAAAIRAALPGDVLPGMAWDR
jgi:hydroxymethylbilane synthase